MRKPLPREVIVQPLDQSYRIIALTKGKVAIVDAVDYDWLMQWNWHAVAKKNGFYAYCRIKGRVVPMHRWILGCPEGVVDHREPSATLDNRRVNLRVSDCSGNAMNCKPRNDNTSGYRGVSWNCGMQAWMATIICKKQYHYLGCYPDIEQAARVRREAELRLFGEFAYQATTSNSLSGDEAICILDARSRIMQPSDELR